MPLSRWLARYEVLFICTENTCRSPLAQALLQQRLKEAGLSRRVRVRSAGTRVTRPGRRPDARALQLLASRKVSSRGLRARQVEPEDLVAADAVLAMDDSHIEDLRQICPPGHAHKLHKLLACSGVAPSSGDVPDPYYGSVQDFARVCEVIDGAVSELALEGAPF